MRPNILILSVSAGAGHVRAAQALEAAARSANPSIANPERLRAMSESAHRIARPHAAQDVIALVTRT
jgi:UDP-N-acetylglucosamine:LPS N-acetylglucosamine transferase